jgi:hypothetical protein
MKNNAKQKVMSKKGLKGNPGGSISKGQGNVISKKDRPSSTGNVKTDTVY